MTILPRPCYTTTMKIGVFDSGVGGKSIADALKRAFPGDTVLYSHDSKNVPYGSKSSREIIRLTLAGIKPLVESGCDVIVIACNTASTNAIATLRTKYPTIFFVGLEPMIKPAAQSTHTKVIAVCATPATLTSQTYADLKKKWAHNVKVIEPDCSTWATLIENDESEKIDVEKTVAQLRRAECDTLVLACTHYHWIKDRFLEIAPEIVLLEPTDAIARRIKHFKEDYSSFTAATN